MKLRYRTSLHFFLVAITVLSICGGVLYFWMQKQIIDKIHEQLNFEIELIAGDLKKGSTVSYPLVTIEKAGLSQAKDILFRDTLIYDAVQGELEEYYYLEKTITVKGEPLKVRAMTAYLGWQQYANMIFSVFLAAACLLCLFGLLVNYYSNQRIWKTFFFNIETLHGFSVSSPEPVKWKKSNITEFSVLQKALDEMTERNRREYTMLREFTENASHEMQTPLSIMRATLEKLSQQKIDETISSLLVDAKNAADRLSKVNRKLLMLAKLENNYFADKQQVKLTVLLQEKLDLMADLFNQKSILVETSLEGEVVVRSDPYIAETLILNLLSNMLRYTPKGGKAVLALTKDGFLFSNDGDPLPFPPDRLFERFKKGSTEMQSNGLGLSIAKQICEVNGWRINYRYLDAVHRITVHFRQDLNVGSEASHDRRKDVYVS